jgi:acyl carrier protein
MLEINIQKLNQIFSTVLELDESTYLDDLNLEDDETFDSLAHVLLIAAIESEFNISIDASDYEKFTSYSAIKSLLDAFHL